MTTKLKVGDRVRIEFTADEDRRRRPDLMGKEAVVEVVGTDTAQVLFPDITGKWWLYFKDIHPIDSGSAEPEYTGGSVSYYSVSISNPTTQPAPYTAECNDIIEALGMNYAEGNAFKAIWRSCAARALGKAKRGYTDALYDAEKVVFFGERMVAMAKVKKAE